LLPEKHKALEEVTSLLLNHSVIPAYPLGSLVVNINVATLAHCDTLNSYLCKVVAVGKFTGGELVLLEPGLVVELESGDEINFHSWKITHFNLPYIGERASLVLHTDKEMTKWLEDHNGWADSRTLQTYSN